MDVVIVGSHASKGFRLAPTPHILPMHTTDDPHRNGTVMAQCPTVAAPSSGDATTRQDHNTYDGRHPAAPALAAWTRGPATAGSPDT